MEMKISTQIKSQPHMPAVLKYEIEIDASTHRWRQKYMAVLVHEKEFTLNNDENAYKEINFPET